MIMEGHSWEITMGTVLAHGHIMGKVMENDGK
jgi:hypothetical protein